jgi:hypothetical protein
VPSCGGLPKPWCAVALFLFTSPIHRSFCMSI